MAFFGLFGPPNVDTLEAEQDVAGLIKALAYPKDARVRLSAAEALGRTGDERAVEPLIAALKDDDHVVCTAAVQALARLHIDWSSSPAARAAVPTLIDALEDSYSLASRRHDGYDDERKASARDVRRAAAEALGRIGDARAVAPLITALKARDSTIRYFAAEALGKVKDARAVAPLIVALIDPDYVVGKAAATALANIDASWTRSEAARAAVPDLIAALQDDDRVISWAAGEALDKIGVARPGSPAASS